MCDGNRTFRLMDAVRVFNTIVELGPGQQGKSCGLNTDAHFAHSAISGNMHSDIWGTLRKIQQGKPYAAYSLVNMYAEVSWFWLERGRW